MDKQPNKLKLPLLILALVLVLGGGGLAIWMVTRKKEEPTTEQQEMEQRPPVKGRTDVTNLYTEQELAFSGLVDENAPDYTPEYTAVLMDSTEGKQLIEQRMKKIQLNKKDSDFVRAKHHVGRTLVGNRIFSSKANKAIEKMFSLVDGTTGGQYLTYPVYGRFETEAAPLRKDIEDFLAKGGQGYNLTNKRHSGNAWWFGSVGLNLMYGSNKSHVHSADKLWWYAGGQEARDGLDFFKLVNGHDFEDRRIVDEKRNGQGVFAAWNMYNFVKEWKRAMEYFDQVTEFEAVAALEREGLLRRI
ncbi:hypothetical protein [Aureispira sp. CCB-QB1]|uniref:hypothetical protein n=1 Tax=Aureispira sp. CCB-QB1 TaxID=1313421 RepID=UPI000698E26E|nr:hypothetical protein [Aureispira sp. CCB-QB1]